MLSRVRMEKLPLQNLELIFRNSGTRRDATRLLDIFTFQRHGWHGIVTTTDANSCIFLSQNSESCSNDAIALNFG